MNSTRRFRIALVLAGVMAAAAWAQGETVTLKEEVYVKGPKVLLGDVAVVEGVDADYLRSIEIMPAAAPGGVRRLNAALVRTRLLEGGLDESQVDIRGSRNVVATTLHLKITRGMI